MVPMYKQSQKSTNAQNFHQFWSHETHYGTSISEMSHWQWEIQPVGNFPAILLVIFKQTRNGGSDEGNSNIASNDGTTLPWKPLYSVRSLHGIAFIWVRLLLTGFSTVWLNKRSLKSSLAVPVVISSSSWYSSRADFICINLVRICHPLLWREVTLQQLKTEAVKAG